MPLFAFAGWPFGPLLADTLNEARALAFVADYDHLGDNTSQRMTNLARIVNNAVSEFLERNTALGQAKLTLPFPTAAGWERVPGTVTVTQGNAVVAGTGTAFPQVCTAGTPVTFYGGDYHGEYRAGYVSDIFTIQSVASNGSLTLTGVPSKATANCIMMQQVGTSYARNVLIPPDLMGQDILEVTFNGQNESWPYKFSQILFLEHGGFQQLPPQVKGGDITTQHPYYCGFNELRNALGFIPWPTNTTNTFQILYRQTPTVLTAADVTTPASIMLGEVPKRFQHLLAMRIAMELVVSIDVQRYGILRGLYQSDDFDEPGELENAQTLISKTLASLTQGRQTEAAPDRVVNNHTIFNFSPVGFRRRGAYRC